MERRMEGKKSCWLRFWALILRWVTLKTYGFPLIIKRDGLLVSAWERLASCPAGFTHRPKCFTSKTHEIHRWQAPADLERGSETYTGANPHSHFLRSFFLFLCVSLLMEFSCCGLFTFYFRWHNGRVLGCSLTLSNPGWDFCTLAIFGKWIPLTVPRNKTSKRWDSSFNVWHYFGFLLTWITSVLYFLRYRCCYFIASCSLRPLSALFIRD